MRERHAWSARKGGLGDSFPNTGGKDVSILTRRRWFSSRHLQPGMPGGHKWSEANRSIDEKYGDNELRSGQENRVRTAGKKPGASGLEANFWGETSVRSTGPGRCACRRPAFPRFCTLKPQIYERVSRHRGGGVKICFRNLPGRKLFYANTGTVTFSFSILRSSSCCPADRIRFGMMLNVLCPM